MNMNRTVLMNEPRYPREREKKGNQPTNQPDERKGLILIHMFKYIYIRDQFDISLPFLFALCSLVVSST